MELFVVILLILGIFPLWCLCAEPRKFTIVLACIWTGILFVGAVISGLCGMSYQRGLEGRVQTVDVSEAGTHTVRIQALPGAHGLSVWLTDQSTLGYAGSLAWKAVNSGGKVDVFPYAERTCIVDVVHVRHGYEPWVDLTYTVMESRTQPLPLRVELTKAQYKSWVVNRDIARLLTWILSGAALFAFAGLVSQVIRHRRNRSGPGRHAPSETP